MAIPTLFVTTSDGRLRPGECRSTAHETGTRVLVQDLQRKRSIELTVVERLNGLRGNHFAMSHPDMETMQLEIGEARDVVQVTPITN